MSTNYKEYRTEDNKPILVEAAKRDGAGKNIENNYAKQLGYYRGMGAGHADFAGNLESKIIQNSIEAYLFRTAGGSLEIGDSCKEKNITGGTIFWNQAYGRTSSSSQAGISYTLTGQHIVASGTCTSSFNIEAKQMPLQKDHKYLVMLKVNKRDNLPNQTGNAFWQLYAESPMINVAVYENDVNPNKVFNANVTTNPTLRIRFENTHTYDYDFYWNMFDLTVMFGSVIADYIYSLETTTPGAGVAWFKKYFPKEYYAYCAPTPLHVKVSGKKIVGFNQFDKTAPGVVNNEAMGNSGGTYFSPGNFVTDYIPVVPGMTYSADAEHWLSWVNWYDADKNFISQRGSTTTVPVNAMYGRWTGIMANKDTACLHFTYDGERDGEFEEYETETYPCDSIDLKGIPLIDAAGNLYFDGDKYWSNGTVDEDMFMYQFTGEQITNVEDYVNYGTYLGGNVRVRVKLAADNTFVREVLPFCSAFPSMSSDAAYVSSGLVISHNDQLNGIFFYSTKSDTAEAIAEAKATLAGAYVILKKTTSIQASATPFAENQKVFNWGTEEYLDAHTGDVAMPVGHDTDYPADLKSKLEILPDLPADDGQYIIDVQSGTAEYIPLADYLSNNGYVKQEDKSSEIVDKAGLTYYIKKAYKNGNIVSLSITALNATGATIPANTTLFELNGVKPMGHIRAIANISDNLSSCLLASNDNGAFSLTSAFGNNTAINLAVCYAIA